jgi:fructose-1,6-bisphosphatase II
VRSAENLFCATGITSGLLFEGVGPARGGQRTQTLTISGITGERQLLTSWLPTHPIGREP